jgi:D-alanyl-D-alanine carboxypeptidase
MSLPPVPPGYESRMRRQEEALHLCSAGLDVFGREVSLVPDAVDAWRTMCLEAAEDGVSLLLLSGFRSIARQAEIVAGKLAGGVDFAEVMRVSAYPGFSEHHTGRAVDIGSPWCAHFTEAFEQTPEYAWLETRAAEFGFSLSYPRDNACGIIFEPWHWCINVPS